MKPPGENDKKKKKYLGQDSEKYFSVGKPCYSKATNTGKS
jgi:hypothetical protein